MASPFVIIEALEKSINDYITTHNARMESEFISIIQAKESKSPLEALNFEAQIRAQQALREDNIEQMKKELNKLHSTMNTYSNDLKLKTKLASEKRYKKAYKLWIATLTIDERKTGLRKIQGFKATSTHPKDQYEKHLLINDSEFILETHTTQSPFGPVNDRFYVMPIKQFFDRYIWGLKNWEFRKHAWKTPGNKYELIKNKSSVLFRFFRNPSLMLSEENLIALMAILNECFPSITQFEGNEQSYNHFIDFMENEPWPEGEKLDYAIKVWLGYGTEEFAKNNAEVLKNYVDYHNDNKRYYDYHLASPQANKYTFNYYANQTIERAPESWFGLPDKNPNFNLLKFIKKKYLGVKDGKVSDALTKISDAEVLQMLEEHKKEWLKINSEVFPYPDDWFLTHAPFHSETFKKYKAQGYLITPTHHSISKEANIDPFNNWSVQTKPHVAHDSAKKWYSLRPKKGYLYVPQFDFINPATWTGSYLQPTDSQPYIEEKRRVWEARYRQYMQFRDSVLEALAVMQKAQAFITSVAIASISGGIFGLAAGVGGLVDAVSGATGLDKTPLGRAISNVMTAIGIANISGKAIEQAIREAVEQEVFKGIKKEVGHQTGLDKTLMGRMALDLTAGTAFKMFHDIEFQQAVKQSADKAWRLEAARQNPYAAILIMGVGEIERKGAPTISSLNPLEWFKAIKISDLPDQLRGTVKDIELKDMARFIGLVYMVKSGRVSEHQALLMVGQQVGISHIKRFHNDEPLAPLSPEEQKYVDNMKVVRRWRKGKAAVEKIYRGEPPSQKDIHDITEGVADPLYEAIAKTIPTKYQVDVWEWLLTDVGVPNVPQYVPTINHTVPEWARTKTTDEKGNVYTIMSPEYMEEEIRKELSVSAHLTKEIVRRAVLRALPINVPLVPIRLAPGNFDYSFLDELKNLKVRSALKRPFDHPMIVAGQVPIKYSKKDIEYMKARDQEIEYAKQKFDEAMTRLKEINT